MGRQADHEVELAVELAVLCRDLKCLPQAGGLFDQDSYYVYLLRSVNNVWRKREAMEQEKAKQKAERRRTR